MTLELYHSAYSTCSQKVRLVLAEKELAFVSREINFATEDQLDPEYLRINPNGVVHSGRGFAAPELESSERQLRQTVDRMETALAESDWLLGDLFSLADCCVGPLIDRMDDLGMANLWSDRPRFTEWLARLRRRPSFCRAFYNGSRLSERPEFRDLVVESRNSRRQAESK